LRYFLAAGGAFLAASTARFIAGNAPGACTLLLVLLYSIVSDERPALFFLLAVSVWASVRYGIVYCLLAAVAVTVMRDSRGDSMAAYLAGSVSLVWLIIGLRERNRVVVLITAIPLFSALALSLMHTSLVPVTGLLLANVITLISLAHRGWANKRLVD
jgi:hypothetical protein